MAGAYSLTEYGLVVTCTGGTGTFIIGPPTIAPSMRICGAACGGSATADIVSIFNGQTNTAGGAAATTAGTLFFSGIGSTSGALAALNLGAVVRIVTPITITFAGGTNGVAILYTPSQNA